MDKWFSIACMNQGKFHKKSAFWLILQIGTKIEGRDTFDSKVGEETSMKYYLIKNAAWIR